MITTMQLGDSGAAVSAFCLGTMFFGTKVDRTSSFSVLDAYWDAGGRFLDTANAYARWIPGFQGGESETLVGEWLKERGRSGEAFIATKVGFPTPVDGLDFGVSRDQVTRAIERSLERLGVERIDLYYAHVDDRTAPLDERLEAFDRLHREGRIRLAGASNVVAWRLEEARHLCEEHDWIRYCCVQQRFSYARSQRGSVYDPHVEATDTELDYYRTRGLTLLAYSPLLGGAYDREDRSFPDQYLGPDTDMRLEALRGIAGETGATPHQVVLAWLMQAEPPVIPVVGASTVDQVGEIIGSCDVKLTEDQLSRLSEAGNRPMIFPTAQRPHLPGAKRG